MNQSLNRDEKAIFKIMSKGIPYTLGFVFAIFKEKRIVQTKENLYKTSALSWRISERGGAAENVVESLVQISSTLCQMRSSTIFSPFFPPIWPSELQSYPDDGGMYGARHLLSTSIILDSRLQG